MLVVVHQIGERFSIFELDHCFIAVYHRHGEFAVVETDNFESHFGCFFGFVESGVVGVELFLIAGAEFLGLALGLVCDVDDSGGTVDDHLDCFVGSYFVLIEQFFSLSDFLLDGFFELFKHNFFVSCLHIFSDIHKSLSILNRLHSKLTTLLPARLLTQIKLGLVRNKQILLINVINVLVYSHQLIIDLVPLFQVEPRLLLELNLGSVRCLEVYCSDQSLLGYTGQV